MIEELKAAVVAAVDDLAPELVDVARQIHQRPETAFEEFFAAGLLCDTLERHGLTPERGAYDLETAFRCDIGEGGPVVAVLSEYDALPGMGHACGHNLIAAIGLGAALALAAVPGIGGRVRYLGTPAEENGAGKAIMLERGAFEGVDVAMMAHPAAADLEALPTLAMTGVTATFRGKPAHASVAPETGVNALDACVSAYQNVAQLRQHISAIERVHGVITFGGDAPNIVPDRAEALYYLRAADARALEALRLRVAACLEAGALGAGATIELDWWTHPCLDLRSNDPLTKAYRANAESLGRWFFEMAAIPPGVAGSTDMGNISYAVPSIHPCIGVDSGGIGTHSHEFVACAASEGGDRAVLDGAKSLAMTAVDYLHRPELQEAVSKRFVPGPRR